MQPTQSTQGRTQRSSTIHTETFQPYPFSKHASREVGIDPLTEGSINNRTFKNSSRNNSTEQTISPNSPIEEGTSRLFRKRNASTHSHLNLSSTNSFTNVGNNENFSTNSLRKEAKTKENHSAPTNTAPRFKLNLTPETHEHSHHISPRQQINEFIHNRQKNSLTAKSPRDTATLEKNRVEHDKVKEAKFFNDAVINILELAWNKSIKKPAVNFKKIESVIREICRTNLFILKDSIKVSDTEFYIKASQNAPMLLKAIQSSKNILKNITKRLNIFCNAVENWTHKDSKWSKKLLHSLKILIKIPTLEEGFWEQLSFFKAEGNERIVSTVFKVFGDTQTEIHSVLDTLQLWSQISKEFAIDRGRIPAVPAVGLKLDAHIRKTCFEILLAETAPYTEHVIPLLKEDVDCMLSIPLEEIKRCIKPENDGVLFNSIIINGKIVHFAPANSNKNELSALKEILPTFLFWRSLFTEIYSALKMKTSAEEIERQIEMFRLKTDSGFRQRHPEKKVPTDKEIAVSIPCLSILKLMTNTKWLRGDAYFREFFTPLTLAPYELKPKEGTECNLTIRSIDCFKITHTKVYQFLRTEQLKKLLISQIPISWTVEKNADKWLGRLQVINPATLTKVIEISHEKFKAGKEQTHRSLGTAQIRACNTFGISPLLNLQTHLFLYSPNTTKKDLWHVLNTLSNHSVIHLKLSSYRALTLGVTL